MTSETTTIRGVYVVIPARGGSKGVPGKNVRTVGGIPLVVRAVTAGRRARMVDRVVVSTDDGGIASLARDAGADVIDRPLELASDVASSESVVLHALDALRAGGGDPEVTVLVQCTSPFIEPGDIDGTIERLRDTNADCAFTATRTTAFVWRDDEAGLRAVNHDPRHRPRRQDRPREYAETGAVYAMRTDGFRRARNRFFGAVTVYEVPLERALEIDEPADLERAEQLVARG